MKLYPCIPPDRSDPHLADGTRPRRGLFQRPACSSDKLPISLSSRRHQTALCPNQDRSPVRGEPRSTRAPAPAPTAASRLAS